MDLQDMQDFQNDLIETAEEKFGALLEREEEIKQLLTDIANDYIL
jgi:hypothetical protein